eukprot:CAMPEP_0114501540 /NCGR_PEP_ID=MMETSP0109-20121206/8550_1 /TAXON_ID=29199 /ORGANISM="Chlorarachnion reptans, Strain CCCM449" /LENGTH=255 /DNA_ID=CAMNT_0001679271 /DNA_START=272 /DNA_END=1039 /DNA_ORIENTATION=-
MISDPSYVKYKGPIDAIIRIPKEQGYLSLWRGNLANCIRIMPTYGIRFALFDYYQQLCGKGYEGSNTLPLSRQMMAGGLSGATAMIFTYPLDILRTRLSTDITKSGLYEGIVDLSRTILQNEGIGGFYKGIGISLIEIAPYTAIAMGGYEHLRQYTGEDAWSKMMGGWFAGLCASLFCYPLDTVKRQLMLDGGQGCESKYNGQVLRCVRTMYQTKGIQGFYGGCLVNALKSSPAAAITFVLNDWLRGLVGYKKKF